MFSDFIIAPIMLKIARLTSAVDHSIEMNGFHEAVSVTLMIVIGARQFRSACCCLAARFWPFRTSRPGVLKTSRPSNLRRFSDA